jgi:hypothetical protein
MRKFKLPSIKRGACSRGSQCGRRDARGNAWERTVDAQAIRHRPPSAAGIRCRGVPRYCIAECIAASQRFLPARLSVETQNDPLLPFGPASPQGPLSKFNGHSLAVVSAAGDRPNPEVRCPPTIDPIFPQTHFCARRRSQKGDSDGCPWALAPQSCPCPKGAAYPSSAFGEHWELRLPATSRRSVNGETCRWNGCITPEPDGRGTRTIRPLQPLAHQQLNGRYRPFS